MIYAVTHGQTAIISKFIEDGTDLNARFTEGKSYLIEAVLSRQTESVNALIHGGADIDAQDDDGMSPLNVASALGFTDIARLLLDNGADTETRDKFDRTPLFNAALGGYHEVVRMLIDRGANVNTANRNTRTALMAACRRGQFNVVSLLLNNGAEIGFRDKDGVTPLYCAANEGHVDIVKLLLSKGADLYSATNVNSSCPLAAAWDGHRPTNVISILVSAAIGLVLLHVSKRLLNNITEITSDDNSWPRFAAVIEERADVENAILSAGADVNTQRNIGVPQLILMFSFWKIMLNILLSPSYSGTVGRNDLLHANMSAVADVSRRCYDGSSALGVASQKGDIIRVNRMLANGAQTEIRDNEGRTPLWFASANGHTDIVCALVTTVTGADVNTRNNKGVSALSAASKTGHVRVVNVLLDSNASTESRDNNGHTPLWYAAFNGHTEVIEALIARGAEAEAVDNRLCSPLSPLCVAAMNGHRDAAMALIRPEAMTKCRRDGVSYPIVWTSAFGRNDVEMMLRLLIESGESVNATDSMGHTPLMLAAMRGRLESVRILVQHGSDIHWRNVDNIQAVDIASYSGHADTVNFLSSYSYNCTITQQCDTPYLSCDISVDSRCDTALHRTTDFSIMRWLLEDGADVEAENIDGLRPIHCAVRTGLVELVELLIQHGANVDAADMFGNRPLHDAACHGLNVVQLMVQHGAKLNVQNIDGKTPLHIAIERQQCDIIMFLLSQDADVGLTDVWRNTPLHYVTSELSEMLRLGGVGNCFAKQLIHKHQHLLIRNTVGVSSLDSIATHVIPVINSAVYCRQEALLAKTTYVDCHGNTPLHYAVGVYAEHKMFKVSTDVSKTIYYLLKQGADINVQNHNGLTPLHVARGEQTIKACLQHAGDQSFTITDKRGRNFWHLLFLIRTQNEVELAATISPMIALSDAKYNVDDLDRTPLHYACMDRNGWIAIWGWLAEEFIEKFDYGKIDKQDKFGRTALHYAEVRGNEKITELLRRKRADKTVRDNFEMTAEDYTNVRHWFQTKMSFLHLTESSNFIARNFSTITQCVRHYYFAEEFGNKITCKREMLKIIYDLRGYDARSYVQSICRGCRLDYDDPFRREPVSHKQCLYERESTTVQESAKQPTTVFTVIQKHVETAMEYLAKEVSKLDCRFTCEVVPVGSGHEGTKIGCCDEFDYNFVLTCLSQRCKVDYSPESPPGFVLLKAAAVEYDMDLFDRNGTLNTRIVKFKFEALVKQVLSSLQFHEATGFEFISPIQDAFLPRGTVSTKINTFIKLKFTQPVNGYHVPHDVSVDIVPALQINEWWPDDARRKDLCQAGESLIVFTQPQNKYPWIGWTEPHGFVSFARAESRLLRECPQVVRAAYMVVKRMSKYLCHYEFFPSYVIKTALLWCLDEDGFSRRTSSDDGDEINADELLSFVQNILRRLLCFAAQDYVPSYFMPKYHQPVWLEERHSMQYHTRLYQHGLTYKDLFSLDEQRSHDKLLHDIKIRFIFSHVMYWAVLSDNDELKFFVPSIINPLTEISYDSDVDTGDLAHLC